MNLWKRACIAMVVGGLVLWAAEVGAQAVSRAIAYLRKIYAIGGTLEVVGELQAEPVRTGLVLSIDGGPVYVGQGLRASPIGNADGGVLLGVGSGFQLDPLLTGTVQTIDGGSVRFVGIGATMPAVGNIDGGPLQVTGVGLDAGHVWTPVVTSLDGGPVLVEQSVLTPMVGYISGALPPCTSGLDGRWRHTAAGNWHCFGALGMWLRYSPSAITLYLTGNEPGTFKGPVTGRRFFINPAQSPGETFRSFGMTATVNAVGTCIGACNALPVGQQIARLAFAQDAPTGNLCYVDVPCTSALEVTVSSAIGACGVVAGNTGNRAFFWFDPAASNCTENPVLTGSFLANVTDI